MELRCYDDVLDGRPIASSIFLAGPTARGPVRTPWRAEAIDELATRGFTGTVVIPEVSRWSLRRSRAASVRRTGKPGASPVREMRATSHNILVWETTGIEQVSVVLFSMPFVIGAEDDPASLPGFTTRAEVSRELERDPSRIVLGMPAGALSSSHIRYHAHRASVGIAPTLATTIAAACDLVRRRGG